MVPGLPPDETHHAFEGAAGCWEASDSAWAVEQTGLGLGANQQGDRADSMESTGWGSNYWLSMGVLGKTVCQWQKRPVTQRFGGG